MKSIRGGSKSVIDIDNLPEFEEILESESNKSKVKYIFTNLI
jgi:hypothetical protein